MNIPTHIAVFVSRLAQADKDALPESIDAFLELCKSPEYIVESTAVRSGPDGFFARITFSDDVWPKKVFVKSLFGSELFSRYRVLQNVLVSPSLMRIYGVTDRWTVLGLIERYSEKSRPGLSDLGRYLLAVDQLLHIQAIDITDIEASGAFTYGPLLPKTFDERLEFAKRLDPAEGDSPLWPMYLGIIEEGRDTILSAITDPPEGDNVLCHGEFYFNNWVITPSGLGWAVRAIDWNTACIGSRWADLIFMSLDSWLFDKEIVVRYASGRGIYGDSDVAELRRIYIQYRVLRGLDSIRRANRLTGADYMGHYLGELLSLQ